MPDIMTLIMPARASVDSIRIILNDRAECWSFVDAISICKGSYILLARDLGFIYHIKKESASELKEEPNTLEGLSGACKDPSTSNRCYRVPARQGPKMGSCR